MTRAYVVQYEARDVLGRIVQEIDSIYVHEADADTRCKVINGDPKESPGVVADVREYPLRERTLLSPVRPRKKRGKPRKTDNKPRKLTVEQVKDIRSRYAQGTSAAILAVEYDVSSSHVWDVVTRKSWKHVPDDIPGGLPPLSRKGERSGNSKLTQAGVRDIRARYERGVPVADLAAEYGMSKNGIYLVISRKNWSHVD